MTTYRIGDIRPNPYRNIDRYPINREKVAALKESIGRTEFWDNLVARVVDGDPQIAYGHHRMVALREMYDDDHEISLIVRDLDDAAMLHIMADENMQEWAASAEVIVETVRAVRDYLNSSYPSKKNTGVGNPGSPNGIEDIVAFLGWKPFRVIEAVAIINAEEDGQLAPVDTAGLSIKQAAEMRRAVARISDPVTRHKAIARVRDDLREGRIGYRDISDVVRDVREKAQPDRVKPVVPADVASDLYRDIDNFWRVAYPIYGRNITRADLIRLIAANRNTEELQGIALPWSEQIALALDEMAKTALAHVETLRSTDTMEVMA